MMVSVRCLHIKHSGKNLIIRTDMSGSTWRQSTNEEIRGFYENEFREYIDQIPWWIQPHTVKQFAVALNGNHPSISDARPDKDFLRRDTRADDGERVFIEDWEQVVSFFEQPATSDPMAIGTERSRGLKQPTSENGLSEPVTKASYYGLDNWEEFWVLAFDIDAKDVYKNVISDEETSYDDVSKETVRETGVVNKDPTPSTVEVNGEEKVTEYLYRYEDIRNAVNYAFNLKEWLMDTVGFSEVRVYYSGQGAHVYAFKDDPYYKFTHQTRRFLTVYVKEKLNIPIDDAVTWDSNRVMRLPYSLHTDVNRVVTEVESPGFDFQSDAVPKVTRGE